METYLLIVQKWYTPVTRILFLLPLLYVFCFAVIVCGIANNNISHGEQFRSLTLMMSFLRGLILPLCF